MSLGLVAYGSSDESEASDADDVADNTRPQTTPNSTSLTADGLEQEKSTQKQNIPDQDHPIEKIIDPYDKDFGIEDEDDFMSVSDGKGLGLKLPAPKTSLNAPLIDSNTSTENGVPDSVIKGLPPPKPVTMVTSGSHLIDETEGELEAEVQPKQYEPVPEPPVPVKRRQPTKIIIPNLPDADSDEDEPSQKKPKRASGGAGLFSVLPSPKYSSAKTTNRPLIPYSLTKKTSTPKTAKISKGGSSEKTQSVPTKPQQPVTRLPGIPDEDSDEEGESSVPNFFSLDEKTSMYGPSLSSHSISLAPSVTEDTTPAAQDSLQAGSQISETAVKSSQNQAAIVGPSLPESSASDLENEPLQFNSPNTELANAPLSFKSSAMGAPSRQSGAWFQQQAPYVGDSEQYNYQSVSEYQVQYEGGEPNEEAAAEEDEEFMKDEQFLRLQGKKLRGKEAINIIDVNADDALDPTDLVKSISEEVETRGSHSRRRKDAPSSQQRRKHQITYLAFQAKERELELKNQWAQNRQTKKQTQSKYGF